MTCKILFRSESGVLSSLSTTTLLELYLYKLKGYSTNFGIFYIECFILKL